MGLLVLAAVVWGTLQFYFDAAIHPGCVQYGSNWICNAQDAAKYLNKRYGHNEYDLQASTSGKKTLVVKERLDGWDLYGWEIAGVLSDLATETIRRGKMPGIESVQLILTYETNLVAKLDIPASEFGKIYKVNSDGISVVLKNVRWNPRLGCSNYSCTAS